MSTLRQVSFALMAALGARPAPAQELRRQYAELHMGVAVRLVLYAPDDATARRAARAAYARMAQLEDVMSDYRPESEVRRLAVRAGPEGGDGASRCPKRIRSSPIARSRRPAIPSSS